MSDEAQGKTTGPRIFLSYSHKDEKWKDLLAQQLGVLAREHLLDAWDDRRIQAGADWREEIARAIEACDVALVLVSAAALTSDFILDQEVPRLLERRRRESVRVIPVIVRPCAWDKLPWLADLQARPIDGKPLSSLSENDADQALADLCAEVLKTPRSARSRRGTPRVDLTHLPKGSSDGVFLGRGQELALLDDAWAETGRTRVVTLVAAGGVGKTTLVKQWLQAMEHDRWRGASRVYAWSFYSQGTDENRQASDDTFLDAALTWFGVKHDAKSAADKGRLLGEALSHERTLLVLDGVEPLQYPPGPLGGRLRAPGVEALLTHVATAGAPGLIVVTTREALADLSDCERNGDRPDGAVVAHDVSNLDEADGARVLHRLGVKRAGAAPITDDDEELRAASRDVNGHALTLSLLGTFLAQAHDGDVRQRDRVDFTEAAEERGGHAFRVMKAYEVWLASGDERSQRALAVARLLGLFDRPADAACLAALRKAPPIAGLTEALVGLSDTQWRLAVVRARECGLLLPGEGVAPLDAHPLVREIFARRLREGRPDAWREGHRRLYEHLKASAPHRPEGLAALQPLYQAVAHGCNADLQADACQSVYRDRIMHNDIAYSTRVLGAIGADLTAVVCFFEQPWSQLSPRLAEEDQAWLLNEAAFSLRALGRLEEASEPMRASLTLDCRRNEAHGAAISANNLSGLELTLGKVETAIDLAKQSVSYADRSSDRFLRMAVRTTLADALHQAGRWDEAARLLLLAEGMGAESPPEYPLLHSVRGFRYCDVLMFGSECRAAARMLRISEQSTLGESTRLSLQDPWSAKTADARFPASHPRADWSLWIIDLTGWPSADAALDEAELRAMKALRLVLHGSHNLLDCALNRLTLARVALYRALLGPERATEALPLAHEHVEQAVGGLRAAGQQDYIPRGLLTRAWLCAVEGDASHAKADLDEAQRIAERGAMKLHLADVHLHRARLFRDRRALAEARRLIEECGYHRRDGELRDAEEAAGSWADA